jgi:hypothetical protein
LNPAELELSIGGNFHPKCNRAVDSDVMIVMIKLGSQHVWGLAWAKRQNAGIPSRPVSSCLDHFGRVMIQNGQIRAFSGCFS